MEINACEKRETDNGGDQGLPSVDDEEGSSCQYLQDSVRESRLTNDSKDMHGQPEILYSFVNDGNDLLTQIPDFHRDLHQASICRTEHRQETNVTANGHAENYRLQTGFLDVHVVVGDQLVKFVVQFKENSVFDGWKGVERQDSLWVRLFVSVVTGNEHNDLWEAAKTSTMMQGIPRAALVRRDLLHAVRRATIGHAAPMAWWGFSEEAFAIQKLLESRAHGVHLLRDPFLEGLDEKSPNRGLAHLLSLHPREETGAGNFLLNMLQTPFHRNESCVKHEQLLNAEGFWLPLGCLLEQMKWPRLQEWDYSAVPPSPHVRLFVSHRWESPEDPDPSHDQLKCVLAACLVGLVSVACHGSQIRPKLSNDRSENIGLVILHHLGLLENVPDEQAQSFQNIWEDICELPLSAPLEVWKEHALRWTAVAPPSLSFNRILLWYDYSSLPQYPRSSEEDIVFKTHLDRLYQIQKAGTTCIVTRDGRDYQTRMWCYYELLVGQGTGFISLPLEDSSKKISLSFQEEEHYIERLKRFEVEEVCEILQMRGLKTHDTNDVRVLAQKILELNVKPSVHYDPSAMVGGLIPVPHPDHLGPCFTVPFSGAAPVAQFSCISPVSSLGRDREAIAAMWRLFQEPTSHDIAICCLSETEDDLAALMKWSQVQTPLLHSILKEDGPFSYYGAWMDTYGCDDSGEGFVQMFPCVPRKFVLVCSEGYESHTHLGKLLLSSFCGNGVPSYVVRPPPRGQNLAFVLQVGYTASRDHVVVGDLETDPERRRVSGEGRLCVVQCRRMRLANVIPSRMMFRSNLPPKQMAVASAMLVGTRNPLRSLESVNSSRASLTILSQIMEYGEELEWLCRTKIGTWLEHLKWIQDWRWQLTPVGLARMEELVSLMRRISGDNPFLLRTFLACQGFLGHRLYVGLLKVHGLLPAKSFDDSFLGSGDAGSQRSERAKSLS